MELYRGQSEETKEAWSQSELGPGVGDITILKCCVKGVGVISVSMVGLPSQEPEVFPQESKTCLAEADGKKAG